MIRITGGKFKGRTLKVPKGQKVRPTRAMVREAIFNILGPRVPGANILDLFAGSGLLGLEAKSRGARQVFFVEQDRAICKLLKDNIMNIVGGLEDTILCYPVHRALKQIEKDKIKFDIILMDPPYVMEVTPLLNTLVSADIVRLGGVIVLERGKASASGIPSPPTGLAEIKRKTYGTTSILIFQTANP